MSNNSNSLLALIAGVAIGTVAGILLAPRSGKETRDKIMEEFDELTEKAQKTANEQYDKAAKKLEELKENTVKFVDEKLKNEVKKS